MKHIKVNFVGFWKKFDKNDNFLMDILKKKYEVEISDNPDYLFYSMKATEHINYDCIRIFYTGENLSSDFTVCDYAIGFDYLDFGDRYLRFPQYMVSKYVYYDGDNYDRDIKCALSKHINAEKLAKSKTDFCSFVYSNNIANPIREEIFNKLSKYKVVNSGGRYMNNIGAPVKDKFEFQTKHKFSIAFENSSQPGYTTEKIVQAFAAGTIPIYWGNPEIEKEFNKNAFINCHEYNNIDDVVERVKEIDNDDVLYYKMLSEPAFCNNDWIDDKRLELEKFIYNIIDQDIESAKRRCSGKWADEYIKRRRDELLSYNIVRNLYLKIPKFIRRKFR